MTATTAVVARSTVVLAMVPAVAYRAGDNGENVRSCVIMGKVPEGQSCGVFSLSQDPLPINKSWGSLELRTERSQGFRTDSKNAYFQLALCKIPCRLILPAMLEKIYLIVEVSYMREI